MFVFKVTKLTFKLTQYPSRFRVRFARNKRSFPSSDDLDVLAAAIISNTFELFNLLRSTCWPGENDVKRWNPWFSALVKSPLCQVNACLRGFTVRQLPACQTMGKQQTRNSKTRYNTVLKNCQLQSSLARMTVSLK